MSANERGAEPLSLEKQTPSGWVAGSIASKLAHDEQICVLRLATCCGDHIGQQIGGVGGAEASRWVPTLRGIEALH